MGRYGRSDQAIRLDIAHARGTDEDILAALKQRHEREWSL